MRGTLAAAAVRSRRERAARHVSYSITMKSKTVEVVTETLASVLAVRSVTEAVLVPLQTAFCSHTLAGRFSAVMRRR